ncbi:hypothetical protein NZD88_20820 [Chryseobacterium antibioticum]|uniref:DUF4304 domain-containing protein n=1 Tax=Chryseobacterium pyrolae TaxID=2987481 RepID=A0ABT2IMW5_9FLAO|nr:hypothetical protein [Chryseobacterium pyrolae]MCT2410006.1 hypothetical protein [Chryseobacterium pyrolae]
MGRSKKNLLIKNTKELIDKFKRIGFEFYQDNNKIHLFSFKNFLIVTLLNLETEYKKKYKTILLPSEEYILFYKKKGTNIHKEYIKESKENINFNLETEYYDLFYSLMHTFYINNSKNYSNYSSSIFFEEIVKYLTENTLQMIDLSESEN